MGAFSIARYVIIIAVVSITAGIIVVLLNNALGLTRERQWSAQPGDIGSLRYTPDGKTLISTGEALRLWDPSTGNLKSTLPVSGSIVGLSPDGNVIAIYVERRPNKRTVDYRLELWNVKTGAQIRAIDHLVMSAAFSPNGKTLATVTGPIAGGNSTIELWSMPDVLPLASHPRTSSVAGLSFSSDGKLLAAAEGNVVELLDPATGKSTRTLTGPTTASLESLHFSPDGTRLISIHSRDTDSQASLWIWDLSTGRPEQKIVFDHPVRVASYSDDGQTLAVLLYWFTFSRHDRVEVWNTASARRLGSVEVRSPWMSTLALSPDGKHVAVGFQQPRLGTPAPIGIWRVD